MSGFSRTFSIQWGKYSPKGGFGALYNWYAAVDVRNISAEGWRIPSIQNLDFYTLMRYYDADGVYNNNTSAAYLKSTSRNYWNLGLTGNNESRFNGKGSGARTNAGVFSAIKRSSFFWDKEDIFAGSTASNGQLSNNFPSLYCSINTTGQFTSLNKKYGIPIRLIKEATNLTHGQSGTYAGNDGKVYPTICIGTQEWLVDSLAETKFRTGEDIPIVTDAVAWAALTTAGMCYYNNDINNS